MNLDAKLSPRENEVAELIAWGASKKEIAKHLCVSIRTVENTVRNIFRKTEVTSASQLSSWWFCVQYKIPSELSPLKKKSALV